MSVNNDEPTCTYCTGTRTVLNLYKFKLVILPRSKFKIAKQMLWIAVLNLVIP
eukprot:SAG31_NODE_925_length_10954_cov_3.051589_1_plen_53_part_00